MVICDIVVTKIQSNDYQWELINKNHDTMYHVGERLKPYIKIENRTNTRQYIGNPI